jgi:hypothetical protein
MSQLPGEKEKKRCSASEKKEKTIGASQQQASPHTSPHVSGGLILRSMRVITEINPIFSRSLRTGCFPDPRETYPLVH